MISYFDRVKYLYPNTEGIVYWETQYDGTPWEHPYDGLVWNNKEIPKPTKEDLDKLAAVTVDSSLKNRDEVTRKTRRNLEAKKDLSLVNEFFAARKLDPNLKFTDFLDQLEALAQTLED